jgi:hypothetical protein
MKPSNNHSVEGDWVLLPAIQVLRTPVLQSAQEDSGTLALKGLNGKCIDVVECFNFQ